MFFFFFYQNIFANKHFCIFTDPTSTPVYVFPELPPKSSILTALSLIRTITTVIEGITHPRFGDAVSIGASEEVGWAGGWTTCGTVILICPITTVIVSITAPSGRDAVLVPTGEGIWRAGCTWLNRWNEMFKTCLGLYVVLKHTHMHIQTWICAVGFICFVDAVVHTITAVRIWYASAPVTGKSIVSTVIIWWGLRVILYTVPLVLLQLHAIGTSTHTAGRRRRETEVAAAAVWNQIASAFKYCTQQWDYSSWLSLTLHVTNNTLHLASTRVIFCPIYLFIKKYKNMNTLLLWWAILIS